LYKTAKQISSDNVQARCILVLSDANACLSMTSGFNLFFIYFLDYGRQEYIYIGDFTDDEANEYLNKVGFTSDKEIRRVLEKIGTKPIDLRNLATSEMKPLEFVEKQIKENEGSVKDCLDYDENNFYLDL
jgi:hypothetical protein